jgi:hypothetical protein
LLISCLDEKEDAVLVEGNENNHSVNEQTEIAWPTQDEIASKAEVSETKASQSDEDEFNDESFHCRELLHMHFNSLDPSLALGFICTCEDDFNDLIRELKVGYSFLDLIDWLAGESTAFVSTSHF